MYEEWEDIEYALLDRPITVLRNLYKWKATIKINNVLFEGVGLTPGMAVDYLCHEIVRYRENHPKFIIARQDVPTVSKS